MKWLTLVFSSIVLLLSLIIFAVSQNTKRIYKQNVHDARKYYHTEENIFNKKWENRLSQSKATVASLTELLDGREADLEDVRKTISELKEKKTQLQTKKKQKNNKIETMIRALTQNIANTKEQTTEIEHQIEVREQELAQMEQKIKTLSKKIRTIKRETIRIR